MVAGGTEGSVQPLTVAGFARARALSTRHNDTPELASRPFDALRDGFVISEGSVVLVLEERERALARNAPILAEIVGYGLACDASHITAPSPDGQGAARAMQSALSDAGLHRSAVDHIVAHATSTPLGDAAEAVAINTVLGTENARSVLDARPDEQIGFAHDTVLSEHDARMAHALRNQQEEVHRSPASVVSTKGSFGHLLGAAGSVNAVAAVMTVHSGKSPPPFNLFEPDVPLDASLATLHPPADAHQPVRVALSNAFGFGGTNTTLCFVKHAGATRH